MSLRSSRRREDISTEKLKAQSWGKRLVVMSGFGKLRVVRCHPCLEKVSDAYVGVLWRIR